MKTLWNHKQLAEAWKISPHNVRGMVSRGEIPFIKIGRSCRFDPERMEEFLRERTREPRK